MPISQIKRNKNQLIENKNVSSSTDLQDMKTRTSLLVLSIKIPTYCDYKTHYRSSLPYIVISMRL